MRPQSNGLVEINDGKSSKEKGFFCMDLVGFLTKDVEESGDRSPEFWFDRWNQAKARDCPYKGRCPRYKKTVKKQKGEKL